VREISRGRAVIAGDEAHHLTRVLRVEAGQVYEISDNSETWLAEVETARKDLVTFALHERVDTVAAVVETSLYVALVKFERIELLLEKATELGVASVGFFTAVRSEKGLDRAAGKRSARWERIVREASEQSRRARLPVIQPEIAFNDVLKTTARCRLMLDEREDAPPLLSTLPEDPDVTDRVAVLVGPVGGWTQQERDSIRAAGWNSVSLGTTILRTETAAIAALAVINAHWGAKIAPQPVR